jgi:hypothetical protein
VSLRLAAGATVTAAGWDSARAVAAHDVDHRDPAALARAEAAAEERFATVVGGLAATARLDWDVDDTNVRLRVRVQPPTVLPAAASDALGLGTLDRTFTVRVERVRADR